MTELWQRYGGFILLAAVFLLLKDIPVGGLVQLLATSCGVVP